MRARSPTPWSGLRASTRAPSSSPPGTCCSPTEGELEAFTRGGLIQRRDCQFHWFNRDYDSFEAFLATFTAEKRKKAKRERRRVAEAGIEFDTRLGGEMDDALWRTVFEFYADTFYRHGHEPYLNLRFFKLICERLPEQLMLKIARHSGRHRSRSRSSSSARTPCSAATGAPAATSTACISRPATTRGSSTASRSGLKRFEPGTQGEHKVPRGFVPTLVGSAHFVADRASPQRSATSRRARPAASTITPPPSTSTCPTTGRPTRNCSSDAGSSGSASTPIRNGFPRWSRRCANRPACSRRAAISSPRACSPPTSAACFPGTRRSSRSCGGRRIRAWCCFPDEFKLSRSLAKTLRNGPYTTRLDSDFGATIRACAAPRRSGADTWLNPEMIGSYEELHRLGFGHSVETYRGERLVGGLYGIQLGGVFFGESMCSGERDASKVALARLVAGVPLRAHSAHRLPGRERASREPRGPRDLARRIRRVPAPPCAPRPVRPLGCRSTRKIALHRGFMHNAPGFMFSTKGACQKKRQFNSKARSSRPCRIRRFESSSKPATW